MDKKRILIDKDRFYELITTNVIFSEIIKAYLEHKDSEDLGEAVIEIIEAYYDKIY